MIIEISRRFHCLPGLTERNDAVLQAVPPTSRSSPAGGSFGKARRHASLSFLKESSKPSKKPSVNAKWPGVPLISVVLFEVLLASHYNCGNSPRDFLAEAKRRCVCRGNVFSVAQRLRASRGCS
jgi:hypothetical protein